MSIKALRELDRKLLSKEKDRHIEILTAQRDELLAALKEVIYCSEHFGKAYAGRDARDKAKSLIKRIDHA